jgi:hypothetical protein
MYPTLEFAAISLSLIFFIVDPLGNARFFIDHRGQSPGEELDDPAASWLPF